MGIFIQILCGLLSFIRYSPTWCESFISNNQQSNDKQLTETKSINSVFSKDTFDPLISDASITFIDNHNISFTLPEKHAYGSQTAVNGNNYFWRFQVVKGHAYVGIVAVDHLNNTDSSLMNGYMFDSSNGPLYVDGKQTNPLEYDCSTKRTIEPSDFIQIVLHLQRDEMNPSQFEHWIEFNAWASDESGLAYCEPYDVKESSVGYKLAVISQVADTQIRLVPF